MKLLRHDAGRKALPEAFSLAAMTLALGLGGRFASESLGEFGGLVAAWLCVAALAWMVLRPPAHIGAERFVFLALWLEQPEFYPGAGYWVTPLETPNAAMFGRMTELKVPGGSFPFALVLAVLLWRRAAPSARSLWALPGFKVARSSYLLAGAGMVFALLVGVLRGGANSQHGFGQLLPLLTYAVEGLALLAALGAYASLETLGTFVVVAAVLRALEAAWVYFVVRGFGNPPEYATHHADSITFVAALGILACVVVERNAKRDLQRALGLGALILAGIVFNNRRVAYAAGAFAALAAFALMANSKAKKKLMRYVVLGVPALLAYLDIGKDSDAGFFKPARLVWSMFDQRDASTASRDIENVNLIKTISDNPLFGSGFGHPYREYAASVDVGEFLAGYQYHPHNTVLALLQYGGMIGFALLWWPRVAQGLLAARGHRAAQHPHLKVAALWAAWCLGVTLTLEWGDQGTAMQPCMIVSALAMLAGARAQEQCV